MTVRTYQFYPSWDGKRTQPITAKLIELMSRRWGTTSLGAYVNRPMRSGKSLSVHATGFACDQKYKDEAQAKIIFEWFLGSSVIDGVKVQHSERLGLQELHWYSKPGTTHGVGYRCSRGEGMKGVKVYTATDNAGPGNGWLHFELSKDMTAEAFETAWRSLPKP